MAHSPYLQSPSSCQLSEAPFGSPRAVRRRAATSRQAAQAWRRGKDDPGAEVQWMSGDEWQVVMQKCALPFKEL